MKKQRCVIMPLSKILSLMPKGVKFLDTMKAAGGTYTSVFTPLENIEKILKVHKGLSKTIMEQSSNSNSVINEIRQ